MTDAVYRWEKDIVGNPRRIAVASYITIGLLVVGLVSWGALVPLASAAMVTGEVAAAGRNVTVQHLEGGIIETVLVQEGDRVNATMPLLVLDPTAASVQLRRLIQQRLTLSMSIAQSLAERDSLDSLPSLPQSVIDSSPAEARSAMVEQEREFEARLASHNSALAILQRQAATLAANAAGLEAQENAIGEQLGILTNEVERKKSLVDKGLTSRFDYMAAQRGLADLIGKMGEIKAQVAGYRTRMEEAHIQIGQLSSDRVANAVTALNAAKADLADVEEQISQARNVLDRHIVRAPIDGIVVSSFYNAPGSVIAPGAKIMEILPTSADLVVDAKLRTQDIDLVRPGQQVLLRLTALDGILTPEVAGEVSEISADRLLDAKTGAPYYRARIAITDQLPQGVRADQVYPGMPVEAQIITGNRTFFEYLVRPLLDSMSHAFREN